MAVAIFNALFKKPAPQPWSRRPLFWLLFAGFSFACALAAYHYFPIAFPLVNIDIKMDRTQALEAAHTLATEHHWGPTNTQQAISFVADTKVQHFIELEGGGNKAFVQMLKDKLYEAYTWRVRHFQEHNPNELTLMFTPEGQPYGFIEKLPENQPGTNIGSEQAQAIVEAQASFWHIDLKNYQLVERSQEEKPSKRIDHKLVFERPTPTIGEGTYRVQFVVSGDRLTEVTPLVKVPESFTRKYEHMRSLNNSIATAAVLFMYILYIALLCALGTIYLIKKGALSLRTALWWALLLAVVQALTSFNELPLKWMKYNTALSKMVFLGAFANSILIGFLFTALLYSLIFVAAEGLTRLAFGDQLQLWRVWSSRIANSYTVLGYTLTGYLLVPFLPAYVVLTYFITRTFFGWWTPSDALIDPNVLATYMPWLTAIGNSLNAGFMEECLFRAVPLASAALIGRYFKQEKLWLAGAFIAQALIFGAGHANYAAQPSYARVVELILPSFGFGIIYLTFGLLTGIIVHFLYDVIWYALPIFVSSGTSAHINQGIIILLCLIPLIIIAYRAQQQKGLQTIPSDALNRNWRPEASGTRSFFSPAMEHVTLSSAMVTSVTVTTLVGLAVWYLAQPFATDGGMLQPTRAQAIEQARNALNGLQISLTDAWEPLVSTKDAIEPADRFIWQHAGKDLYTNLRGTYLKPPRWVVRFVNFNAPLADRAEEYDVVIMDNGNVQRIIHQLPESRPGAQLDEPAARQLALAALKNLYQVEPPAIEQVSAVATKQPNRKDWTFTYQYPAIYPLSQGQARLGAIVSGDQVTDVYRFIYTPEEWTRADQNLMGLLALLKQFFTLALVIILALASILYVNYHRTMSGKLVLLTIAGLLLIKVTYFMSALPAAMGLFQTSVTKMTQLFLLVGQWLPRTLIQACSLGILIGILMHIKSAVCITNRFKIFVGLNFGIIAAVAFSLIKKIVPSGAPAFASYSEYAHTAPIVTNLTSLLGEIALESLIFWMLFACLQTKRVSTVLKIVIVLLAGFFTGGSLFTMYSLPTFLATSAAFAFILTLAYYSALQYEPALTIPFFTGFHALFMIQQGLAQPYPTALLSAIGAVGIAIAIVYYLFNRITQAKPC